MEKILDPFYHATNNVFINMFQSTIQKGEIQHRENIITSREANINIGFLGDLNGSVIYSFSKEIALVIAAKMGGIELEEFNEFAGSAVSELANIISGHAVTNLYNYNYKCDILCPELILSSGKSLFVTDKNIVALPIKSEIGEFEIYISIKKE